MAFLALLLSLLCILFAKQGESIIEAGSWLSAGHGNHSSWVSPSGHFAFGFYPQGSGFAVGIWLISAASPPQKTIVWTANRDSFPLPANSTLNITTTGLRLFPSGREGYALISPTNATSASMLDSGNFVLYSDNGSTVVWQSFDHPTDTLLGGQSLVTDAKLVSSVSQTDHSSGAFFIVLQEDANLVAYPVNSTASGDDAYWASNTWSKPFTQLRLNVTGYLCFNDEIACLYNNSSPGNKSDNTNSIYRATLAADGNFILYEHQFEDSSSSTHVRVLWRTSIETCQIKGFCGFNSYCSNVIGDEVCQCFPGFVPSNSSRNVYRDCVLAYAEDGCRSSYNITQLEDVYWADSPYSVIPMRKKECEKSLLDDCDCTAVLYSNGNCQKYGLPLTYGIRLQNSSIVALFKDSFGILQNTISTNSSQKPKFKVVTDNKKSLIMILAFTLGSISFLSLIFAVSVFITYKRNLHKYRTLSASENLGFTGECSLRSFSFDELVKYTGGFTEEIGRGSFGAVYRGETGDDTSIAVKRLERVAEDDGEREFRNEITSIARTHHRNLVKLVGFCMDGARNLLVYEYVRNGSLGSLLFDDEKQISWRDRLKIALDVARGVLYLHDECEVRIIHCNINPGNILLDETWTAKISDFGFAKLLKKSDHSRMRKEDDGTRKYLAPEWQKDAPVSVKLDIYSFGMVVLEIVCRRRSIEMNVSSEEEILLSSWVYKCFVEGQLNRVVKEDEVVEWKIMERMVKVGLWCVQDTPSLRPLIKNVILMLEGLKDIPIPPSPTHPHH